MMPAVGDVVRHSGLPDPWIVIHIAADHVVVWHGGTRTARVLHASRCTPVTAEME